MKKYFFAIAALAALTMSSCNPDNEVKKDEPTNPGITAAAAGNLVINEYSGNSKFIELYNISDKEISLEGVTLLKNDEEGALWTGLENHKLAAGAFMILYSNKTTLEGAIADQTFNGGLSPKKSVKLELLDKDGNSIQAVSRGPEPWDSSCTENKDCGFSRVPDGTGEFVYAVETPGAANGEKVADIVD